MANKWCGACDLVVWLWPANPVSPISLKHQPPGQLDSFSMSLSLSSLHAMCSTELCISQTNQWAPPAGNINCRVLKKIQQSLSFIVYLKDGNPGVADVVKVDGSLKRVDQTSRAVSVVLVPIDTSGVVSGVVRVNVQFALMAPLRVQLGNRVAVPHTVISWQRADEGVLVIIFSVVVFARLHGKRASGGRREILEGLLVNINPNTRKNSWSTWFIFNYVKKMQWYLLWLLFNCRQY